MPEAESIAVGRVAAIYRYPVRSMRGESLAEAEIGKLGLVGDRAYSVVDLEKNAMACASTSARKWKGLLEWRVEFAREPELFAPPPPIRLTNHRGDVLESDAVGFEQALEEALGRKARMRAGDNRGALSSSALEKDARARGEAIGTPEFPSSPYLSAAIHVLTTASLAAARAAYPEGRFDVERFRPNLVIETQRGTEDFVEKNWLHQCLVIGEREEGGWRGVELGVFEETARCVLTIHPQFDLPKDPKILRTIVEQNRNQLGVYAGVTREGRIRVGDPVVIRSNLASPE